jgi:hypothetical protein
MKDAVKQFVALRATLAQEKARLEARLSEINRALGERAPAITSAAPRSTAARGRRSRATNAMSLKEAVTRVTRNKPMTRPEILQAIKKIGYKFTAKDPMNSLNVTLYTKGNFKNDNGKFSPVK